VQLPQNIGRQAQKYVTECKYFWVWKTIYIRK